MIWSVEWGKIIGSFSIDDGNGNDNDNDNATNKEFDWTSEEK